MSKHTKRLRSSTRSVTSRMAPSQEPVKSLLSHPIIKLRPAINNNSVTKSLIAHRAIRHPMHFVTNPHVSRSALSRHSLKVF